MQLKNYEAYGLTLALAGNMEGVSVTRVSIPIVGKSMYAISSQDGKVDISINPEEQDDYMDVFRDSIAQLYNYTHSTKTTSEKLENDRVMEMRAVDILNKNKYNIADYHPNPPMRLRGTHTSYLEMFKRTDFASPDFAMMHTATMLSASLYQDLNTTTISEMLKAIDNNREAVEDYIEMGDEILELQSLIDNGMAGDITEAFRILHGDEMMEEDDDENTPGKDK